MTVICGWCPVLQAVFVDWKYITQINGVLSVMMFLTQIIIKPTLLANSWVVQVVLCIVLVAMNVVLVKFGWTMYRVVDQNHF